MSNSIDVNRVLVGGISILIGWRTMIEIILIGPIGALGIQQDQLAIVGEGTGLGRYLGFDRFLFATILVDQWSPPQKQSGGTLLADAFREANLKVFEDGLLLGSVHSIAVGADGKYRNCGPIGIALATGLEALGNLAMVVIISKGQLPRGLAFS